MIEERWGVAADEQHYAGVNLHPAIFSCLVAWRATKDCLGAGVKVSDLSSATKGVPYRMCGVPSTAVVYTMVLIW